jgi:hypothetical protein
MIKTDLLFHLSPLAASLLLAAAATPAATAQVQGGQCGFRTAMPALKPALVAGQTATSGRPTLASLERVTIDIPKLDDQLRNFPRSVAKGASDCRPPPSLLPPVRRHGNRPGAAAACPWMNRSTTS